MAETQVNSNSTEESSDLKKVPFFKPKQPKGNLRKRKVDNTEEEGSAVILKQKDKKENPLVISTKDLRKKKDDLSFATSGSAAPAGPQDQGATLMLETETERDRDSVAISKRKKELSEGAILTGEEAEKIYKGMNNYTEWLEHKEQYGLSKGTGIKAGPIRGSLYHRAISRIDYQPDVCKDYKDTGYCGFGDSCKFLHDRGDYKSGWEIDRDWEEEQKQKLKEMEKQMGMKELGVQEDEQIDVPFACSICREYFDNPVRTKCKHYFCEKCALEQFRSNPKCAICDQNTGGSFLKVSKAEKAKLDRAKEIEERRRARENAS